MPNTDRLTRTADSRAACRIAESHSLSRALAATHSRVLAATQSGVRSIKLFTGVRKTQETGKDCRTFGQRDSFECTSEDSNTQVQHIVMNSQKVPKVVEVPKQQYTDMNVDEPAEMQRQITSTHRKQKAEQVSVSCTSGRRHCRVTTTRVNDSKGTRVSSLTRRTTRAE